MDREYIDGFLLGDGCLSIDKRMTSKKARATCTLEYEEFCEYSMKFFTNYGSIVSKYNDSHMKQGFGFFGRTKYSESLYQEYLRWYPENPNGKREKQVPADVIITPLSVMIWYLGDGSIINHNNWQSMKVRLSTDSFKREGVQLLVDKMNNIGILCHIDFDQRIQIKARGIPAFFDFIGRTSPVKCYDYKFNLPTWRFESKRMKDVANELKIDYNRLCYFVKIGRINCYRLSEKGRPRFLPEQIEDVKKLIGLGVL
jgi:hypothetical protein